MRASACESRGNVLPSAVCWRGRSVRRSSVRCCQDGRVGDWARLSVCRHNRAFQRAIAVAVCVCQRKTHIYFIVCFSVTPKCVLLCEPVTVVSLPPSFYSLPRLAAAFILRTTPSCYRSLSTFYLVLLPPHSTSSYSRLAVVSYILDSCVCRRTG